MSKLDSRVGKLEKALGAGTQQMRFNVILSLMADEGESPEPPADVENKGTWLADWRRRQMESLGPVEKWLTYQEQLAAANEANESKAAKSPLSAIDIRTATISLSLPAELEARRRAAVSK